ncbi:MAG: M48 family metalloprotease, partial [Gammaproteobacteria bacterium]|nr:M48 family metalloprotease [Gammaproteobacteria bacterium]
ARVNDIKTLSGSFAVSDRPWRRAVLPSLLAGILLAGPAVAQDERVSLPSMGDPADQILSPARERELGEAFMRQVGDRLQILEDPLLSDYLFGLGARLITASQHTGVTFTFFFVNDATINAFAAPGGFIGVNSGLMLATTSESQLAGVLAHEVAHVTQRHIARAYAASQTSSLPTAAAILAAILLGGTNPQASQAAIATGIATTQQLQLNYTRANEYEADRLGIRYLARAQFNPSGMVDFFDLLERRNAADGISPPEYLSTHPLSSNRVAEARSRAQALTTSDQRADSMTFQLARARLQVLTTTDPTRLRATIDRELESARGIERQIQAYTAALLAYRTGKYGRAAELLQELNEIDPDNIFYNVLSARNVFALGRSAEGKAKFEQLLQLYPSNVPVLLAYAEASEEQGDVNHAARALREALQLPGYHLLMTYRALARIEDKRDRPVESLESLAEYHALSGQTRLAINQLEQALKRTDKASDQALRIAARLQQLRDQFAERLRERGG